MPRTPITPISPGSAPTHLDQLIADLDQAERFYQEGIGWLKACARVCPNGVLRLLSDDELNTVFQKRHYEKASWIEALRFAAPYLIPDLTSGYTGSLSGAS